MGQSFSSTAAAFFLAASILDLLIIYFVTRNGYAGNLAVIQNLGIAAIPNPNFFRFVWPLFIFTACVGYFWAWTSPGIFWRWGLLLFLTFINAFFLFGTDNFSLYPLALISNLLLVIVLGESIYYLGVTLRRKTAASFLGFYFIWSIYGLFFLFSVLLKLLQ